MRAGFKTIDCDRHVVEPVDMWEKYLDPKFQHYNVQMGGKFTLATRIGGVLQNDDSLGSPGSGMAQDPIWRKQFKHGMTHNFEPQAYVEDMDKEGVDIAVCFTGIGLYATWGDDLDPELSAAMCRAYNNWLYDFMSYNPDRLKGVCLLPLQNIELAAQELKRCATELGMVGIFWRPNPHMGRLMSDRAYDPIYAIAEEYGLNISVHEGIQNRLPWFPQNRINTHFAHHASCHPMEQMAASLAMASGGVFDRFPKLTASFLESGAGWLPHWLERLDQQVENPMLNEGYGGKEKPSEYFRRGQGFVSCEAGEEALPAIQRSLGDNVTMWASDYPHRDAMMNFPRGLDILTSVEGVTPDFMKQLLWDNPAKCFNLKV